MNRRFLFYFLFFLLLFTFALLAGLWLWGVGWAERGLVTPLGKVERSFWGEFFRRKGETAVAPGDGFGPLVNVDSFRVPILVHHYVEVVTDERDFVRRAMSIRPDVFERQLIHLLEEGYTFVTLDDLSAAVQNQENLPEKPIILTFDDGYRDFYTEAFPILQRHNVRAINFVVFNFIGKDHNYMDETQIREVLSSGLVEIGSHTLSHPYLTHLSTVEAEKEIAESKRLLEEKFGVAVSHFAYPGGYSTEALERAVAAAGYLTAVGTQKGEARNDSSLYRLPRIRVGNLSPAELLSVLEKTVQPSATP